MLLYYNTLTMKCICTYCAHTLSILSAFSKQAYIYVHNLPLPLTEAWLPKGSRSTLPWLLLLVAVTAVLPTNADYNDSDNDIRSIIQNAVENNSRTQNNPKGTQFACCPDSHFPVRFCKRQYQYQVDPSSNPEEY